MMVRLETIVSLARRRGFIFPGSEIYGGLANSWDYGPLGALLKNNVKQAWWRRFVLGRADVVGIDAAVIMNPKVWEASGHLTTFSDPLIECKVCHERFRVDQVASTAACSACGATDSFTEPANFNLMFKTFIGPKEDAAHVVYLRPETAQAMFVNFKQVTDTMRCRLPFGIAQIGRAWRNEITPGNFIFRTREFEQMEIEYFVHPREWEVHFEAWRVALHEWIAECGITAERVFDREVPTAERAHYSARTVDIDFEWPFGRQELYGLAYRGDFDLAAHSKASGQELHYTDPATGETFIPHVVEPTWGVDRTILAMLVSAYTEERVGDEQRVVLKFPAALAPYQVAVLPLSKKDELLQVAQQLAGQLRGTFRVDFDVTQSIGRRYRRQDEIGTPWCITVDFESLNDHQVTVRDRDSMRQDRIALSDVTTYLYERLGH